MHDASPEEIELRLNSVSTTRVVVHKVERVEISPIKKNLLIELQREHWRKLHTQKFTAQQFEDWVSAIPGCATCQRDFRKILKTNKPVYDDWERWTWEIHNVVNTKLGKQLIAWTDAIELWGWPIKDIPSNGSTENAGTKA